MSDAKPTRGARRDPASTDWFDGLHQGRLLVRRCPLGHVSRHDVLACGGCGTSDLSWHPAVGDATVISVAVDHGTAEPTTIALVELAEGPWLLTRFGGPPAPRGAPVRVTIVEPDEGEPYPVVTALPS